MRWQNPYAHACTPTEFIYKIRNLSGTDTSSAAISQEQPEGDLNPYNKNYDRLQVVQVGYYITWLQRLDGAALLNQRKRREGSGGEERRLVIAILSQRHSPMRGTRNCMGIGDPAYSVLRIPILQCYTIP